MKRRIKIDIRAMIPILVLVILSTFCLTGLGFMRYYNSILNLTYEDQNDYKKLAEVAALYQTRYIGEPDWDAMMDYALKGYVAGSGDKYGAYLTKEEMSKTTLETQGKGVGIGITVTKDSATGNIRVIQVYQGSPAQQAGLKAGDLITAAGGKVIDGDGYAAVTAMIPGEEGTSIVLGILRDESQFDVTVERRVFEKQSVEYRLIGEDIGFIRISDFNQKTPDEFKGALESLLGVTTIKGLVFDVRNNPGGELDAIVGVLDQLVGEGTLVTLVNKAGEEEKFTSDANEVKLPMAVLINGQTASAAELFAAALRDYNKGPLIGEKTYGKGVSMSVIPFPDGSGLVITDEKYNPPSGENYNGVGITPTIEVKLSDEQNQRFYELNETSDPQLIAAVAKLRETN